MPRGVQEKARYGLRCFHLKRGGSDVTWYFAETARNNAYDREKKNVGTKWRYVKKVQR